MSVSHCVHRLHLIWLGSVPPNTQSKPYRRYIVDWRAKNPTWEVYLWTDRSGRQRDLVHQWCEQNGVRHHSVLEDARVLWGIEKELVFEQLQEEFYANASDLIRLRILYQMGGLYVDSDVEPTVLPDIELPLGIGLLLRKDKGVLQSIAPHAIAAVQGHPVLQIALWQGGKNFDVLSTIDEQDFRYSESISEQYGGVLMLTGDLLRPALQTVFGLFGSGTWDWSPWLEAIQLSIAFRHYEDNSWLNGGVAKSDMFFPPALGLAIAQTWVHRSLTSILHLTAAHADSWMIAIAAQQVVPFENHFGYSPKRVAIQQNRSQEIIRCVPAI